MIDEHNWNDHGGIKHQNDFPQMKHGSKSIEALINTITIAVTHDGMMES